jgi:hypothetical protein
MAPPCYQQASASSKLSASIHHSSARVTSIVAWNILFRGFTFALRVADMVRAS